MTGNAVLVGVIIITLPFLVHYFRAAQRGIKKSKRTSAERSAVSSALAQALPDSVFFGPHLVFVESIQSYWAMQERDIVPQCIVRPRTAEEAAIAVTILKRDYDERISHGQSPLLLAVRSGGHSPIPGAANISGGIVIDLRLLSTVVTSNDRSSVSIGTGARWLDVSKTLDKVGLAVAGGRNSAVGVGGLTLGVLFAYLYSGTDFNSVLTILVPKTDTMSGGLSFFSPRVGFVCNNILSYEIVLANGTLATASESINPGLWRALKGGSNNFGIVTKFVARSFPSTNIWGGFLYMTSSKVSQLIDAFHRFTESKPGVYDEYAAGPLVCFSQKFVTTTVKNHYATLVEIHALFERSVEALLRVNGMIWTLVLQPLLPASAMKGQLDSQGLSTRTEPLVVVLFTAVWKNKADDLLVEQITRNMIDSIDLYAASRGAADPYRYLNNCASWQNPFDGYGAENKRFLQQMSRTYDPDGLFQKAFEGGFKLDMESFRP
ncbi:MAG: hypothetical protein Q9203_002354 [Teloschistes exilis]